MMHLLVELTNRTSFALISPFSKFGQQLWHGTAAIVIISSLFVTMNDVMKYYVINAIVVFKYSKPCSI